MTKNLKGKPWEPPLPEPLPIEADMPLDPIEDAAAGDEREEGGFDLEYELGELWDESGLDLEDALGELVDEHGPPRRRPPDDPPLPPPPGPPEPEPPEPLRSPSIRNEDAPSSEEEPPAPPPAPAPAPPPPPAAAPPPPRLPPAAPVVRRGGAGPWGPDGMFRLLRKAQGWEARCPYHKGTATAPACKKLCTVPGNLDEAERLCKEWLVASTAYTRKRTHLAWRERPRSARSHAALEAAVAIMVPPVEPVLNDAELDALDGFIDGEPTSSSSSD